MSFRDVIDWVRETVTVNRLAYAIGFGVSGGVGHCVAIASVAPRVDTVEADLADLRLQVALDRRVMDRIDGMTEAIAASLGLPIPPPISRNPLEYQVEFNND